MLDQHPGARLGRPDAHQHRALERPGAVRRLRRRRPRLSGTRSSTAVHQSVGRRIEGLPAWPLFETLVGAPARRSARSTTSIAVRGARRVGRSRPTRSTGEARHRLAARDRRTVADDELRGELYDELVRAMQRVPELAGRELTLTALSGGITNRNFRVDAAGTDRALGHPAGRQRHAPARHQPRGRARRDGRGGRRRRRAGGDRVHPAGGLPRHPVHRRVAGLATRPSTSRRRSGGSPTRSAASTTGRRSRACSCRSGSSRRTGRWRSPAASRSRPSTSCAAAVGRRIELRLPGRPDRAAAVPQRPAQRQLHRRRRRGSGSSTGSTPGWATRSSISATSASTTS